MDYWLRDQRQPILRSPPGSNPEARTGTGREVHLVCNIKIFSLNDQLLSAGAFSEEIFTLCQSNDGVANTYQP